MPKSTSAFCAKAPALWIAWALGGVAIAASAGQSAVAFRVAVNLASPAGGVVTPIGIATGGVVCRSIGLPVPLECSTGGGTTTPSGTGNGGVDVGLIRPDLTPITPNAPAGDLKPVPEIGVPASPVAIQNANASIRARQVIAAGVWTSLPSPEGPPQLPEIAPRTWIAAASQGFSGAFGVETTSRVVTVDGRDYLEMTVSW